VTGEARRRGGARSIGDLLAGFLEETKAGREIARERVEAAWRAAVGPEVAAETRVQGLRDGVLSVEVASSALLQELKTFYRASILAALKAGGGAGEKGEAGLAVREITFKLGAMPR
jgi:predicted nucleic acid-binding Zn ribbon protein